MCVCTSVQGNTRTGQKYLHKYLLDDIRRLGSCLTPLTAMIWRAWRGSRGDPSVFPFTLFCSLLWSIVLYCTGLYYTVIVKLRRSQKS